MALVQSGNEEPMSTHADHFMTNFAYGRAAYSKGAVFLNQLKYIIGEDAFHKGLLRYFYTWRFKHPNPNDCIRIFEKESGLELDWYKEYWVNTTHFIEYGIRSVEGNKQKGTTITLERLGGMPMPIDVVVSYKDGSQAIFTIPLDLMRGNKIQENKQATYTVLPDWQWVNPTYEFVLPQALDNISKVEIDPTKRLADMISENNVFEKK